MISPVLAVFVDLDPAAIPVLTLGLLIGTPALSLLGAIAAALTLGARRPGVLVSLLVLPLYLPPLIFGTGAVEASLAADGARAHLLLLGAITLAALPLAPLADRRGPAPGARLSRVTRRATLTRADAGPGLR